MAQIKIAEGGSLKRFRSWIKNTFYDKTTVDGKLDAIGSVEQATSSKAGIMKLFTALGQNTDGAPTNKAVQDAISAINTSLGGKSNTGHTHDDRYYTEAEINAKIMPVNSIYVQFRGQSEPSSLFGGTWSNISSSFAGEFFRAEGGKAASFGSTQTDAIRNITGTINEGLINVAYNSGNSTDVFNVFQSGAKYGGGSDGGKYKKSVTFDASRSVPTADENRPYNSTIRIWKRTE